MYKWISLLMVALAVFVFVVTDKKTEYVANGFGALMGIGLGVCVDRWLEEEKRKKSLNVLLRACMQLTNSNIGKIDDVMKRYGLMINTEGRMRAAFADLLSGIPHESYASFIGTGFQSDLNYHFQNKFLYCRALIVDLHGYMAGRNSMPASHFATGELIELEWKVLVEKLSPVKSELLKLADLIRNYLNKAGEKEFE